MVMAAPRMKLRIRMSQSFRDFVIFAPMWLPIRLMDMWAPRVNRPMPKMSMAEPIRKDSISPVSMGTSTKHIAATIPVMGSTEAAASRSFSMRMCFGYKALLL